MHKQKSIILFLIFIILGNICSYAQTINEDVFIISFVEITKHLSNKEVKVLRTGKALSQSSTSRNKERLKYMPSLEYFKNIEDFIHKYKPTILYETLYFVPIKNFQKQLHTMVNIFNYFRDISNFVNIYYQNIKKGHIHPLFLSSKQVISKTDKTVINTLKLILANIHEATNIQEIQKQTVTVLQDMPPFGDVISYYNYSYNNTRMAFRSINITPLSYNNIEAVKPYNMLSAAQILRTDEGILIYGIGAVRITGFAVLFSGTITNSFESRMVGLFSWVKNAYEGNPQLK